MSACVYNKYNITKLVGVEFEIPDTIETFNVTITDDTSFYLYIRAKTNATELFFDIMEHYGNTQQLKVELKDGRGVEKYGSECRQCGSPRHWQDECGKSKWLQVTIDFPTKDGLKSFISKIPQIVDVISACNNRPTTSFQLGTKLHVLQM